MTNVSLGVCVFVCVCATADTYKHTRPYKANALHKVREVRANMSKRVRLSHESTICMKCVRICINKAGFSERGFARNVRRCD